MRNHDYIPEDIVAFWFPGGDAPTSDEHARLWNWRVRGGAHEVIAQFSQLTAQAAAGDLDDWTERPIGRLALVLILDQFTRSVWAGTHWSYRVHPWFC